MKTLWSEIFRRASPARLAPATFIATLVATLAIVSLMSRPAVAQCVGWLFHCHSIQPEARSGSAHAATASGMDAYDCTNPFLQRVINFYRHAPSRSRSAYCQAKRGMDVANAGDAASKVGNCTTALKLYAASLPYFRRAMAMQPNDARAYSDNIDDVRRRIERVKNDRDCFPPDPAFVRMSRALAAPIVRYQIRYQKKHRRLPDTYWDVEERKWKPCTADSYCPVSGGGIRG